MEKLFQIRFSAKAERLCLVRTLVKEMAQSVGCCVDLSEKLVIAVNEACMNIIQHAYKGDESGEIVFDGPSEDLSVEQLSWIYDSGSEDDFETIRPKLEKW